MAVLSIAVCSGCSFTVHFSKWSLTCVNEHWTGPFLLELSLWQGAGLLSDLLQLSHLVSIFLVTWKVGGAKQKSWIEKFCSKDTVGRCFLHGTALLDKYCSVIQKLPLKITFSSISEQYPKFFRWWKIYFPWWILHYKPCKVNTITGMT